MLKIEAMGKEIGSKRPVYCIIFEKSLDDSSLTMTLNTDDILKILSDA